MTPIAFAVFNRNFKFKIALVLAILHFPAIHAQAAPRQATDAEIKSCRFVSWVSGDSGYGKNNDWKGIAKQEALRNAEKLGGSDVVWERFIPIGSFKGMVDGKVYDCGQTANSQASTIN